MKPSLWKDIVKYGKTKGKAPLDERQMDTLKDQYMELAKSVITGFLILIITYGYMDMYGIECEIPIMYSGMGLLGAITYYHLIRFAYLQIIGIDVNFEILLVPAFLCTPFLFINSILVIASQIELTITLRLIILFSYPLIFWLLYVGVNHVYRNGRIIADQNIEKGEMHFKSRKQIVNYLIIAYVLLVVLPISYDLVLSISFIAGSILTLLLLWYYGFHTPHNTYILNEEGLRYHKTLWNGKGGFLRYDEIASVKQQDTFNIGYQKDKVCIVCKDGSQILLYPENAYRFCTEIENNLY